MLVEGLQLGRYRLLRLVGHGATSVVYLAEDQRISRQVALKIIQSENLASEDARDIALLFQREAHAIARLNHSNILPLLDFGEEVIDDKTLVYLVIPYCPEGSLARWLRQRSATLILQPQEVLHIMQQAADALEYAHDQHIVHRDVKPSNFLIRSRKSTPDRPDLLLADFGIARFTRGTTDVSKTIRGTPLYMSPEQWRGHVVPATDQYALAIMAYELLTSRPPFLGTQHQVMYQHSMIPPPPPSTVNLRITPSIDAVILRALAKEPETRFPSITEFAHAFQQAVQTAIDRPIISLPSPPPSLGTPLNPPAILPPSPTPPSPGDTRHISIPRGQSNDVHTNLTISMAEAMAGVNRTVTFPGGQQVTVAIPAGAYDGQVLWLKGQVEPSSLNAPKGELIITISITPSTEPATIERIPGLPSPRITLKRLLLSGLALLFVIASIVGLLSFGANLLANRAADATASANQSTVQTMRATSTADAATASVALTKVARVTATTTEIVNLYEATHTMLALNETLDRNSDAQWDEIPGSCTLTAAGYHVRSSAPATLAQACLARKTNFSDMTFEVQMNLLNGNGGGLLLRATDSASYYFRISPDRYYTLFVCAGAGTFCNKVLVRDFSSQISQGLQQSNLIAVVARGNRIELYVNHKRIDSVNDGTSSAGQIGVVAEVGSEVVFSHARIWTV